MDQLRTPPSFHPRWARVGNPRLVDFIDRPPGNPPQVVRVSNPRSRFTPRFLTPAARTPLSLLQDRADVLGLDFYLVSGAKLFFISTRVNGCWHTQLLRSHLSRIIAFRFIPSSVVSKPVAAVWGPLVGRPFDRLPRTVKLGLGWLALLAIVFGSAFGFSLPQVSLFHAVYAASMRVGPAFLMLVRRRELRMVIAPSQSSASSSSSSASG